MLFFVQSLGIGSGGGGPYQPSKVDAEFRVYAHFFSLVIYNFVGKSFSSAVKNPSASARDAGLIPGSGRFPGEGNGNPLQYSWRIPWTEEPVWVYPANGQT